jgi:GTPase SAR1 family protein
LQTVLPEKTIILATNASSEEIFSICPRSQGRWLGTLVVNKHTNRSRLCFACREGLDVTIEPIQDESWTKSVVFEGGPIRFTTTDPLFGTRVAKITAHKAGNYIIRWKLTGPATGWAQDYAVMDGIDTKLIVTGPPTPMPPDPTPAPTPTGQTLELGLGIGLPLLLAVAIATRWFKMRQLASQLAQPLLASGADDLQNIPSQISQQGHKAIQAYNSALLNGKQTLKWTKLMFVGQERVGKTSLLRTLTKQEHNPNEVTTDGTDICVIEDWKRLEQHHECSKFDEGVAHSVGDALLRSQSNTSSKRKAFVFSALALAAAAGIGIYFSLMSPDVAPTAAPTAAAPTPIPPTPAIPTPPTPAAPTPTPTPPPPAPAAPTPVPTQEPTPEPAPLASSILFMVTVVLGVLVCIFPACFLYYKRYKSPKPEGLLPVTSGPTSAVLRKMPVDLIVNVMNGDAEQHMVFSAWDFAGQEIYYSVHSLFITQGVYVVVFSMQDALGGTGQMKAECLEKLAFWMSSIHYHTNDPSEYHVIIVGTHRDIVTQESTHLTISKEIEAAFKGCSFWPRVQQPNGTPLCFFPIDNTAEPTAQFTDQTSVAAVTLSSLHACINELGQELADTKNNEYPLTWLSVLDDLQQMASDGVNFLVADPCIFDTASRTWDLCVHTGNVPSASGAMLHDMARKHGIDKNSVEYSTLCTFLSEVGSFVPFRNLLVIRPNWVADVLFAVVTRPSVHATKLQPRPGFEEKWLRFGISAVVDEGLLGLLWEGKFEDEQQVLVDLMLFHDLMFELHPAECGTRQFLVPAKLPNPDDLAEDTETGSIVLLHSLQAELEKVAASFEGFNRSSSAVLRPVQPFSVSPDKPACYFVFEKLALDGGAQQQGFLPEGLWFVLLVKCARWAQETDSEWSKCNLASSFRRDVARFSFGAQQFELRLHRAEHAIRLVVFGECCKYPKGVLLRVRSILEGIILERFRALDYFVALRVEGKTGTKLENLDRALQDWSRRNFCSAESFMSSISGASTFVVVENNEIEINSLVCEPWAPPSDSDTSFDVFISAAVADRDFACKLYTCFEKCNTDSGGRVRVFLHDISDAHKREDVTPVAAISSSCIFVPIISMKGIASSGAIGSERIPLRAMTNFGAVAEWISVVVTLTIVTMNCFSFFGQYEKISFAGFTDQEIFLASMVVPRIFNLVFVVYCVRKECRDTPQFVVWLQDNLTALSMVGFLAFLRLDNLSLLKYDGSKGIAKLIFTAAPPMFANVVNKSRVWGLGSTLCGDLPQLIVTLLALRGRTDRDFQYAVAVLQSIVSVVSLVQQVAYRALASILVSSPSVDQRYLDQFIDTGQLLECMVASHNMHTVSRGYGKHQLREVLPVILDVECLHVEFCSAPIPTRVLDKYTNITQTTSHRTHARRPNLVREVFSTTMASKESIRLWHGGGLPVDKWNHCELVAATVTEYVSKLSRTSTPAPRGTSAHEVATRGREIERRRARRDNIEEKGS